MFTDITEADGELLVTEVGTALHIRSTAGSWSQYALPYNSKHRAIVSGNGKYIAYGIPSYNFSPYSLISTNGYIWFQGSNPGIFSVLSIAYGNGQFVYAGLGGLLQRSVDGENFEDALENLLPMGTYFRLVRGSGCLVITGYRYYEGVPEGIVLTQQTEGGEFVLVRPEGMPALEYLEWTGQKFIGAGYTSLAISADGLEWSLIPLPSGSSVSGMAIGPDRIVCTTSDYPSTFTVFSLAGDVIFHDVFPDLGNVSAVQFGSGFYWAIANGGYSLYKSADGISWEMVTDELPYISGQFCAAGGRLVMLGYDGISAESTDGVSWHLGVAGTGPGYARSLRYLQNRYVAVVSEGTYSDLTNLRSKVITSPDGVNWQVHDYSFGFNGIDITYDNGRYCIGGLSRESLSLMESDISVSLQLSRPENPVVTIDGPKQRYYRVERGTELGESADWTEIDRVFAPQMPFAYEDNTATGSGPYFYRINLEPEPVEE